MAGNIEPNWPKRGGPSDGKRPVCARTRKRRRKQMLSGLKTMYPQKDLMDLLTSTYNSIPEPVSSVPSGSYVENAAFSSRAGRRPETPDGSDEDDGNSNDNGSDDGNDDNSDDDNTNEDDSDFDNERESVDKTTMAGIDDDSETCESLRTSDDTNDNLSVDVNNRNGSDISISSRMSGNDSAEDSETNSSQDEETENEEPNGTFNARGMENLLQIATMRPQVSENQILAMIIAISTRHRLTYQATMSLLKMMTFITNGSKLPTTMPGLWAMLLNGEELGIVRHWFCRSCKWYLGTEPAAPLPCSCKINDSEKERIKLKSYFIQIPLTAQLKQLLAQPGIADSLLYRQERTKKEAGNIEDIYDGSEYCKLSGKDGFLDDKNNFSLTVNTDGCQVAESSNASAWPVLFTINELPPHLRQRYVLLAGVWVETVHPNMNMILSPIVNELNTLYQTGITWRPNGNAAVTSKFITPICIADSPARCAILRMAQYNGKFGCTYCLHEGLGQGGKRVYPVEDETLRTDEDIRRQMDEAFETQQRVYGVRGYSIMSVVPEFNLAKGAPVDPMHNLDQGVMRQHVMLLLYGAATDPWYNGQPNKLSAVDAILLQIRTPGRISRKPRSIKDAKLWKASEWRNMLLYYSPLCFEGIVRPCDLNLLTMLSRAGHILYRDSISAADLEEAKSLLLEYVKGFQTEYTVDNMTYNIHLLNHVATSVEDWGPLWANTAFVFESFNKKIIDSVTSANSRPTQIVTRYLMHRFMQSHMYDTTVEQRTRQLVHSILNSGKKHKPAQYDETVSHRVANNFKGLGRVIMAQPNAWQSRILLDANYVPEHVMFYKGAKINGIEYRCRGDREETRSCNKFVCTANNKIGEILHIIEFRHDEHSVNGLIIDVLADDGIFGEARHIRKLSPRENSRIFIGTNNVEAPVIFVNNAYGITMPNVWEAD